LDLLFDGLMSGRQHDTDPSLCFTDGAATEAQTKVLFQLLQYLADALIKLATLQGDVTEQVHPHLGATHHLGQVKHLINPIRFVMRQHFATTAEAISRRIVRHNGQTSIV